MKAAGRLKGARGQALAWLSTQGQICGRDDVVSVAATGHGCDGEWPGKMGLPRGRPTHCNQTGLEIIQRAGLSLFFDILQQQYLDGYDHFPDVLLGTESIRLQLAQYQLKCQLQHGLDIGDFGVQLFFLPGCNYLSFTAAIRAVAQTAVHLSSIMPFGCFRP